MIAARWLALLALTGCGVAPAVAQGGECPPPPENWLATHFLIGVDLQPASSAGTWAARGVNTLVRVDHNQTASDAQIQAWDAAAAAAGLRTIRQPQSNPAADIGNPTLLAWAHRDEPDLTSNQIPPAVIQQRYADWKAIDPHRPVFIGVTGSFFQHDVSDPSLHSEPWYREYFAGADWLAADRYPVNLGKPIAAELGPMFTKLHTWQEPEYGKPVFAAIEASDYDTTTNRPAPGPTPGQLRAEVWYAITQGARGIFYFPERVAPTFVHDATTPAVQAEMTLQNGRITELAALLQTDINPAPFSVVAPAAIAVGWRVQEDGDPLFVAVNMSANTLTNQTIDTNATGSTATVEWEGRSETMTNGNIVDDFAPWAIHVYRD